MPKFLQTLPDQNFIFSEKKSFRRTKKKELEDERAHNVRVRAQSPQLFKAKDRLFDAKPKTFKVKHIFPSLMWHIALISITEAHPRTWALRILSQGEHYRKPLRGERRARPNARSTSKARKKKIFSVVHALKTYFKATNFFFQLEGGFRLELFYEYCSGLFSIFIILLPKSTC